MKKCSSHPIHEIYVGHQLVHLTDTGQGAGCVRQRSGPQPSCPRLQPARQHKTQVIKQKQLNWLYRGCPLMFIITLIKPWQIHSVFLSGVNQVHMSIIHEFIPQRISLILGKAQTDPDVVCCLTHTPQLSSYKTMMLEPGYKSHQKMTNPDAPQ